MDKEKQKTFEPQMMLDELEAETHTRSPSTNYSNENIYSNSSETFSSHAIPDTEEIPSHVIDDVDQSNRWGNYVLTVGNINSGKSTLQQWLVTWFFTKGVTQATFKPIDGAQDPVKKLYDMVNRTLRGEFPASTLIGKQEEFQLSITPKDKKKLPLDFGFFEISGEDLKQVIPDETNAFQPYLPSSINRFLDNKKIRFTLLFVSNAEAHAKFKQNKQTTLPDQLEEDALFCSFMDYLERNFGNKFKRAPILLCISKWDYAKQHFSNDPNTYFKKALPQTYTRFLIKHQQKIPVMSVPFSVGRIRHQGGESKRAIVEEIDDTSTQLIASWIYRSFTRKDLLGESSWLKKAIRRTIKWV